MPQGLKRYYGHGHVHFVTFSCWRRLPLLGSARRRDLLLRALERVCRSYRMAVIGYVAMPEHVHVLVCEPRRGDLSVALKAFKQGVARRVMNQWRQRRARSQQSSLFDDDKPPRFWQPRFYDFNVFTRKKLVEKLRYLHRNPVKRGLVSKPEDWRWSSYRSYAFGEPGLVALNVEYPAETTARAAPTPTRAKPARVGHPRR